MPDEPKIDLSVYDFVPKEYVAQSTLCKKYCLERHVSIICDLEAGLTRECAAARAGVGNHHFKKWMKFGKQDIEPFTKFYEDVRKAERTAEASNVITIQLASKMDWKAAAWWLERKFPETWSPNSTEYREAMKLVKELSNRLREQVEKEAGENPEAIG